MNNHKQALEKIANYSGPVTPSINNIIKIAQDALLPTVSPTATPLKELKDISDVHFIKFCDILGGLLPNIDIERHSWGVLAFSKTSSTGDRTTTGNYISLSFNEFEVTIKQDGEIFNPYSQRVIEIIDYLRQFYNIPNLYNTGTHRAGLDWMAIEDEINNMLYESNGHSGGTGQVISILKSHLKQTIGNGEGVVSWEEAHKLCHKHAWKIKDTADDAGVEAYYLSYISHLKQHYTLTKTKK